MGKRADSVVPMIPIAYVCVRGIRCRLRERETESMFKSMGVCKRMSVCKIEWLCVCVGERERKGNLRERESK